MRSGHSSGPAVSGSGRNPAQTCAGDHESVGLKDHGSGPTCSISLLIVVVAPNGDIFVTDSHRNGRNNRVVKFTKEGKDVKEWGRKGSGRGELSEPLMVPTTPTICSF
jgi:hypothetical protein